MKLTCLSKGKSFHFPASHMLSISGFQILLECPLDLSALSIFSPVPPSSFQSSDLIKAVPWYKTVDNLHLWDVSSIDIVLISSPMAMLGLPFLTRHPNFSATIYATEATSRLGQLMMEDLVAMHCDFSRVYGLEESGFLQWTRWEEVETLPSLLREIAVGENGVGLGNWQPLYSTANVKECIQKVCTLKYAEEACYNGSLVIKPFSSGLEIGSSNWVITGLKRSITYMSNSLFESAHAMGFDYSSLQGNDVTLFSDFSHLHGVNAGDYENQMRSGVNSPLPFTSLPDGGNRGTGEEIKKSIVNNDELREEMDKVSFICSAAVNAVQDGGSVLLPFSRLGIVTQLLEHIPIFLESLNLKVPIFVISSVAEEMFAFMNVVPEWLCKRRQEKLYSSELIFGHAEFLKQKKIQVFPAIHSSSLLRVWKEPSIVFCPHWSLRLGPMVHLIQQWHQNPNSLLVLEDAINVDVALIPFKPLSMKVLQCSFQSGTRMETVQPLLEMLQPKIILFPEDLRVHLHASTSSILKASLLYYTEGETLKVPRLIDDFEAHLSMDLAFQLQPTRMKNEDLAIARLRAELLLSRGKHFLVPAKGQVNHQQSQLLRWGFIDPEKLLLALQEKGVNMSLGTSTKDGVCLMYTEQPHRALIEISPSTIICTSDETLASIIIEAVDSVLDGI